MTSVTDSVSGKTLTVSYNADNKIDSITGPVTTAVVDGIWVSYSYDANGNLIQVTYADDNNGSAASGIVYAYGDTNDLHNLTSKSDLDGHLISSWTYDASDRVTSNTNAKGKSITNIDYSVADQVSVTDSYGITSVNTISEIAGRKRVTQTTKDTGCATCSGDVKQTDYDPTTGYPVKKIYFNDREDLYQNYDANGNPQTIVFASGTADEKTIYKTYLPVLGSPLTVTEPSVVSPGSDKVTIYDYDDPQGAGDTDTPNENPTNRVYRIIGDNIIAMDNL